MLKKGDWVEITPKSDTRWSTWISSQDIYDHFCSKVGVITNICEDDERPGHNLYSVKVEFPNGLGKLNAGAYYEWFRDYHLILSSKARATLQSNMSQAGKELQEWEAFKKKTTHEMLKKSFVPQEKTEYIPVQKIDDPNQWDIKTDPTIKKNEDNDHYDTYYDFQLQNIDANIAKTLDAYYNDLFDYSEPIESDDKK